MTAAQPDLADLVRRLEAATVRLEEMARSGSAGGGGSSTASSGAASAGAASAGAGEAARSPSVAALDELINTRLADIVSRAGKIGGVVAEQAEHLKNGFHALRNVVVVASQSKKPSSLNTDPKMAQDVSGGIRKSIEKVVELKDKNRSNPLFNHLTMVADGIPALGWILVEPTPAPYIGEMRDSAQFYGNRVIKEYKDKDKEHVEWVNGYVALLGDLQAYVKQHHTTGLSWNPRGDDIQNHLDKLKGGQTAATAATATPSSGGAPAPPPPPAAGAPSSKSSAPQSGAPDLSGLFSQLNAGDKVTAGLRKVDKSEMTHKNPELRAGSVVKAEAAAPAAKGKLFAVWIKGVTKATAAAAPAAKKPPKMALEGSKWVVEHQENSHELSITDVSLRQSVYVFNCNNATLQIKGKVNSVTLDSCRKIAVVIDSVVATVDIVNSKTVQLQVMHTTPTIAVDKTDGCQIYLSQETLSTTEIYTAKSSEVNVLVPPAEGSADADYSERPISEQFKTTFKDGKVVTVPVEHTAG
ncbi:suppressor of rasval19 [Sorochytrium milnesiophthora]